MKYLKKLRKEKNMTQVQIAKTLGVSRPTYILIEKGERYLTLDQALTLSDIYKINIKNLADQNFLYKEYNENLIEEKKSIYSNKNYKSRSVNIEDKFLEEILIILLGELISKFEIGIDFIGLLIFQLDYKYFIFNKKRLFKLDYIKENENSFIILGFEDWIDKLEKEGKILLIAKNDFDYRNRKYIPLIKNEINDIELSKREFLINTIEYYKKITKQQIMLEIKSYSIWKFTNSDNNINFEI